SLPLDKLVSTRDFCRWTAAIIRSNLLDLVRTLYGPRGEMRHRNREVRTRVLDHILNATPAPEDEPYEAEMWRDFHELVPTLADEDRELIELRFYNSMKFEEIAEMLETSVRTLRRRWRELQVRLHRLLVEE